MAKNIQEALQNIDMTYDNVIDIANDIIKDVSEEVDGYIQKAYDNIENLSNDAIRDILLRLSLSSYSFSEIKEKSVFKAELAETLRKEAYATEMNGAVGTVAQKEATAVLNTSAETVAEAIYDLVASMSKSKIDEIHRVVDTLKTILTSRLTEAKLNSVVGID